MSEARVKGPAGQGANAGRKTVQGSSDHVPLEEPLPGNRSLMGSNDPDVAGGSEQPKNDRRKRGDLDKRGLR